MSARDRRRAAIPEAAMQRAMKVQEVILRAMAGRIVLAGMWCFGISFWSRGRPKSCLNFALDPFGVDRPPWRTE